ncbi:hypothetical protein HYH03_016047 [Edaphochlamys debaryana]|uniref:Uncharacterized protein n=1 Tax=Edaphochlamys debaryana TaxID=47281 RepID=A0A836BQL6_9CHLO|nr:hypothetical protein HYH03_016047 [Edaphochlamys debaryana]|eukprot:KAG2485157.1 hypothetical protein HYH03_016047 [Edaphochlamys debaryana]
MQSRCLQLGGRQARVAGSRYGAKACTLPVARRAVVLRVTEKDAELAALENVDQGLASIAKQILETDPEARESLRRYEAAVVRLEKAKAASEELERMFAEAQRGAIEADAQDEAARRQKAEEVLADAEVAAAERRVLAAEMVLAQAQAEREAVARALRDGPERIESLKAAAVATAAGLAAELPLVALAAGGDGAGSPLSSALSLAAAAGAAFLFGATYRYAVRDDSSNTHLRGGVVAAFALVRVAGAGDALQAAAAQAGNNPLGLDVVGPAALYGAEGLLMFGFASVALEIAFSQGWVKRFGQVSPS